MSPSRSARAAGGVFLFLFTLAFFHRVVTGGLFYFGDFQAAFEPLRRLLGEALRRGLPLWTGAIANGRPFLANPLASGFYPPNLLFAAGFVAPARLLTFLTVAHVFWGAWGAYRLARRLGQSEPGCLVAGVCFAFSGTAVSNTYAVVFLSTAAWIPWLLGAGLDLRAAAPGRRLGAQARMGLDLAMMILAGDPVLILSGLVGLAFLLPRGGTRAALRTGGRAFAALVFGAFLAAPSLWASFVYLPATVRARGFSPSAVMERSLHPAEALGLIVPGLFGSRFVGGPDGFLVPGQADGNGFPLSAGLYVGPLAFALALAGALRRRPYRFALASWLILLFLLALGRYGPLVPLLVGLPGFDVLRYPAKWLLGAMLPLALLAGEGAEESPGDEPGSPLGGSFVPAAIGALLLPAVLSVSAVLGFDRVLALSAVAEGGSRRRAAAENAAPVIRDQLLAGSFRSAVPLLIGLLAFLALRKSRARRISWALAGLLCLDLLLENPSLAPTVPFRFYESVPATAKAVLSDSGSRGRVWIDQTPGARGVQTRIRPGAMLTADVFRLRRERLDIYSGASYGLRLAFNADLEGLSTTRYARLKALVEEAPLRERLMLLGAAGVTHLVTPAAISHPHIQEILVADVGADAPLRVFRNLLALPRARVVTRLYPWTSVRDVAAAISSAADDFFTDSAFVEAPEIDRIRALLPADSLASTDASRTRASIVSDVGHHIVLRTSGPAGFLVLSDCLTPGWSARFDGRPVPLFSADIAFRLVPVPAGDHEVVFDYNPWRVAPAR